MLKDGLSGRPGIRASYLQRLSAIWKRGLPGGLLPRPIPDNVDQGELVLLVGLSSREAFGVHIELVVPGRIV